MDNFIPQVPSILIEELGLDFPQILDFDFYCNTIPSEKTSINSNFEEFFDEHPIKIKHKIVKHFGNSFIILGFKKLRFEKFFLSD